MGDLILLSMLSKEFKIEFKLHTSIPINEILVAVCVILNETVFSFNNTIYKQKFGCSMGNPLSI